MSTKLFEQTTKLWAQAFEDELLEDIDQDVALGAYYAKLALDGTVELNESGLGKVEAALEALSELLGGELY
jgi:hypothetical protein